MKPYKEILLLNSCENELYSYKRMLDMFGLAEHVQVETNGKSALYYLGSNVPPPELIIASLEVGEESVVDFVAEYEKLHWTRRKKMKLVLLYKELSLEFERLKKYRQFRKPLNVFELTDDNRPHEDRLLN
jgi:hypothetical protein